MNEDRPPANIAARPVRSTVPDLLGAGDVFFPLGGRVLYTVYGYDSAHAFRGSVARYGGDWGGRKQRGCFDSVQASDKYARIPSRSILGGCRS